MPAFKAGTQPLLFQEILTKTPSSPKQINPEIPPEFDDIIGKLMEKDRELRSQTAADICADLKRLKRNLEMQRGIAAHIESKSSSLGNQNFAFRSSTRNIAVILF